MSTPHDPVAVVEPRGRDPYALEIVELTAEEWDQMFEERVWEESRMTGDEFLARYASGELSDPGHPDYAIAGGLYVMRPVGR